MFKPNIWWYCDCIIIKPSPQTESKFSQTHPKLSATWWCPDPNWVHNFLVKGGLFYPNLQHSVKVALTVHNDPKDVSSAPAQLSSAVAHCSWDHYVPCAELPTKSVGTAAGSTLGKHCRFYFGIPRRTFTLPVYNKILWKNIIKVHFKTQNME